MNDRDTQPAPPPDEIDTKPHNEKPTPTPADVVETVGRFAQEVHNDLAGVEQSFSSQLAAVKASFDRKVEILTNQWLEASQRNVQLNEEQGKLKARVGVLEVDIADLSKRVDALEGARESAPP